MDQTNHVSASLVRRVKPKWVKSTETRFSTFGGHRHTSKSKVYEIVIKGGGNCEKEVVIEATAVPVICSPLSRPQIDSTMIEQFELSK